MKLKRKWARLGIVMAAVVLVSLMLFAYTRWVIWTVTLWAAAIVFLVIRYKVMRCPNCHKGFVPVRWDNRIRYRCGYCGKRIPFDDDVPTAPERTDETEEAGEQD